MKDPDSNPPYKLDRRRFLKTTTLAGVASGASALSIHRTHAANKEIRVATLGLNGRGRAHVRALTQLPNVRVIAVCDPDSRAIKKGIETAAQAQDSKVQGYTDFRKVLERNDLDAITIATPNHWHAPAAILGLSAGKHVYVEKPGSHNPHEAHLLMRAAEKSGLQVQMGNQRRSWPWVNEAIQRLQEGAIGDITFARTWYNNRRGSIGTGERSSAPDWLDYNLWQGPAKRRPFKDNLIHYNWHWHWLWGNGELGNNGVHALDIARWGLGVSTPKSVSCVGGRYRFNDDQETPDTAIATYDFGNCGASWEGHSCDPKGFEGVGFGIHFYGSSGSLVIAGNQYQIYDSDNKQVDAGTGDGGDTVHFKNFLEAIRNGTQLTAPIQDAQHSALLCHYGNIAYRTQSVTQIDPKTGMLESEDAQRFWKRDYEPGFEPTF